VHTYWYQEDITLEPETDYVLGGWVKLQDVEGVGGAFLHVFAFPEGTSKHGDRLYSAQMRAVKGTADWREHKLCFRTTSTTHHGTFFAQFSRCSGTCWFDDLYVRPARPDEVSASPPWAREAGIAMWQSFDDLVDGRFTGVGVYRVPCRLYGQGVRFTDDGKFGGALELTKEDGHGSTVGISVGDSATIETWVYRRKQDEFQAHGEVLVRGGKWGIRIGDRAHPDQLTLVRAGDWRRTIYSKTNIPFDEWTHLAMTHDNQTNKTQIFVNGALDAEADEYEFETFSGKVVLGVNTKEHRFVGTIDELGIFRRVKSAEEIRRDMSRTEPAFTADNGVLKLSIEKSAPYFLSLFHKGRFAGRLGCAVAQFEKEGMGYKKCGVGSAYATAVKTVKVETQTDTECVVDVTLERTRSVETQRKFEATYRLTLRAGRPWFKSRLLSVKNTDSLSYELRGYYHILQPKNDSVLPRSYPQIGGWIGQTPSLGALCRDTDAFTLGFRKTDDHTDGSVTRRHAAPIQPGMAWSGNEPGLLIFAVPTDEEKEFYRAGHKILTGKADHGAAPAGAIVYGGPASQPETK